MQFAWRTCKCKTITSDHKERKTTTKQNVGYVVVYHQGDFDCYIAL